jgi:hypothetical protein
LLSNVFDPSLVIGAAYQALTVATTDGRVLSGLLAEDNDQRIVLKTQGGKLETVARADVDEIKISSLSLMPEELEKQLQPQELADLFAFITLDKPPGDPTARQLPRARALRPREATDLAGCNEILAQFAPGFSVRDAGQRGLAIVEEHLGRTSVLRTHPLDKRKPLVLLSAVAVPKDKQTRLMLTVSHHPLGDWRLIVKVDDEVVHDSIVGAKTTNGGWADIAIDLSRFAGEEVDLEVLNQANDRTNEFAFWERIEVVSQ